MRRKSGKEIRKEYAIFLVYGCVFTLLGLFILTSPLIPPKPYEEYRQKDVVISKFDYWHTVKGSSYHYILTENGEKYNLTGKYSSSELYDLLLSGTCATIKYDENLIFPFKKYVEEITVNGNKIVTYDNDKPPNWTVLIIAGSLSSSLGICSVIVFRLAVVQNRKKQRKRDARIIKKYGMLKE
jgi:predicted small secreted protein